VGEGFSEIHPNSGSVLMKKKTISVFWKIDGLLLLGITLMLNSTSAVSLHSSCLEKNQGLIFGIGFTLLLSRKTKIVGGSNG